MISTDGFLRNRSIIPRAEERHAGPAKESSDSTMIHSVVSIFPLKVSKYDVTAPWY